MINPTGRVLSLVDSPDGARAVVIVRDAPACPRCAAGKGCGAGILAANSGERQVEATVPRGLEVAVHDDVEISMAPDNILRAAVIVYGIPMLGALAGAALAYASSLGDSGAAGAALAGLGAGLVISRLQLQQASCLRRFTPAIEKRC
jgi:sigma-E factor negative regulatory protein RseC